MTPSPPNPLPLLHMQRLEYAVREEGQGGRRQATRIGAEASGSWVRAAEKMGVDSCIKARIQGALNGESSSEFLRE